MKFLIASLVLLVSSCTVPVTTPTASPTIPMLSPISPTSLPASTIVPPISPTASPIATKASIVAKPQLTLDTLPRISGSTSTQPLTVVMLCNLLGWEYAWHEEATGDSPRTASPVLSAEKARAGAMSTFWERAQHSKTHESYVELINGKADLILVAREPSSDELTLIKEKRVTLDIQPLAWDALVFVVNKNNPITGLTTEQIREIYSGKPMTWESLGGKSTESVKPLARNENSGSHELFKKHVMGDRKIVAEKSDVILTMMGMIDRVGNGPNDLGYSVFYYVQFMVGIGETKPLARSIFPTATPAQIKTIGINGVAPDQRTIANGTYPLREPVYIVLRKDASPAAVQLRDWLLSNEGQKSVAESGYVRYY